MHPCATALPSPADHGGSVCPAQVSDIAVWHHFGGSAAHPPLALPHIPPQHIRKVLPDIFYLFSVSLLKSRQQRVPYLQQTLQHSLQDAWALKSPWGRKKKVNSSPSCIPRNETSLCGLAKCVPMPLLASCCWIAELCSGTCLRTRNWLQESSDHNWSHKEGGEKGENGGKRKARG